MIATRYRRRSYITQRNISRRYRGIRRPVNLGTGAGGRSVARVVHMKVDAYGLARIYSSIRNYNIRGGQIRRN